MSAVEPARADEARIRFQVAPQSYAEALLDLAQQANVTLIGAGACKGETAHRLSGALTLETALARLLADAPCRWRVIAPGAVMIEALPSLPPPSADRPEPPVTVAELLVTATKRVRDPRQLAVAVSAIPQRQLQATGASDAADAAGQVAGVLATNLGPGRNKLLLRALSDGAYTGRTRSTVATYLDDIPINYNAPDPDLRLVDVERVEVARGPQGALYGAGSISGIYRIVTRRPDLHALSGGLRGGGALTDGGAPSYAVEGHLNTPILRERLGVRLAAYQEVQGGYLDDLLLRKEDVDRTERRGARLSLVWRPGDDWTLGLTAAGQHLRSDNTHYTTADVGKRRRAVRIEEPHVNDIDLVTLTVRKAWGWGELATSAGFVRHAYSSLFDATATQHLYTGFATTSAYSERTRTRMLVQDTVLSSRGAGRLEWLAGVYAAAAEVHSPTQFLAQNPFAPNVIVYADDRTDELREVALYGEASYALDPRWTVAAGARLFDLQTDTRSEVVSERFAPRSLDRESSFTGVSPKVSIQRSLGAGDLVYAVISEGHRGGGVNSGGALPLPLRRETFAPDRLRNYEVGLKVSRPSVSLSTAVFYAVWRDIQTDQFRPSGIPYTANAGDAGVLGLEAELGWRGARGFSAQLNGRVTRTRMTRVNPDFAQAVADSLPGAPAVSGGALVSYDRDLGGGWSLQASGQAAYVGPTRVSFDPAAPESDGHVRARLLAEIRRQGLGAQVYVSNPLNASADTFAFGNPFNPTQARQLTPQRPITAGLTLFAAF